MSIRISRDEAVELLDGRVAVESDCSSTERAQGMVHDSREVKGGEIFIALRGEHNDGVEFINSALSRGASFCVATKVPDECSEPERVILVESPLDAYWTLAAWWRKKLGTPILAITGSVGKTTVKEMAATVLMKHSRGLYSEKSYNNHTGVPYTLGKLSPDHQWGVLEMGMNNAGELTQLSNIVCPDVVLITCIAEAHIGAFESINHIARAKLEALSGLKEDGMVVLNGDDHVLMEEFELLTSSKSLNVCVFGEANSQYDTYAKYGKTEGLAGVSFELNVGNSKINVRIPVPGIHNVINATAAICGAKALLPAFSLEKAARGLEKMVSPLMRLNVIETKRGVTIVDDSYNANPRSMKSLIELACALKGSGAEKVRVGLVLGEMKELGHFSAEAHRELGRQVAALDPSLFYFIGSSANEVAQGYGGPVEVDLTKEIVAERLVVASECDVLFIKASRSVALDQIVSYLARIWKALPPYIHPEITSSS